MPGSQGGGARECCVGSPPSRPRNQTAQSPFRTLRISRPRLRSMTPRVRLWWFPSQKVCRAASSVRPVKKVFRAFPVRVAPDGVSVDSFARSCQSYNWRGAPSQPDRMPFDVLFCPLQPAFFARYEPLRQLLALAFREAIKERLEGSTGTCSAARGIIQTVAAACGHIVSYEYLSFLVVAPRAPALRTQRENEDVESWMLYIVISGTTFAFALRRSLGERVLHVAPRRRCSRLRVAGNRKNRARPFNAAYGNVVFTRVAGVLVNDNVGRAPHLRVCQAWHMSFLSDTFPFSCEGDWFFGSGLFC